MDTKSNENQMLNVTGGAVDNRGSISGPRRRRGGIGGPRQRPLVWAVLLTLGAAGTGLAQQEPFTMIIMNDPQISYYSVDTMLINDFENYLRICILPATFRPSLN